MSDITTDLTEENRRLNMNDPYSHVPSTEVKQDIADTEQEIVVIQREIAAFELMPRESAEFRMAQFRASARRDGIKKRGEFITKLQTILASRSQTPNAAVEPPA